MRNLYPPFEAYRKDWLKVSDLHEIYFEESGNPQGQAVIYLHGGPGSGSKPGYRQFFNPQKYRVIVFDQRGCGQSKPLGELKENTTQNLVGDIEKLRQQLKIESWLIHGGSWGSALALAYAETHPEKVKALIIHGIFTCREWEIRWIHQEGASQFYPEIWPKYLEPIPPGERHDLINAYYKRLTGKNREEIKRLVVADKIWEAYLMKLIPQVTGFAEPPNEEVIAKTKIYFHYIKNKYFLREGELLEKAGRITNIPGVIIQGRYDLACPPQTAWELHQRWPKAELVIVQEAGHHSSEPGIIDKLIEYTDKFADL